PGQGGPPLYEGPPGADTLREHVGDAHDLEYGAHRAAGDYARAFGRRLHIDLGRAVAPHYRMVQRAVLEADTKHLAPRFFHGLLHRYRNFARFALAHPDPAVAIANHRERSETEDAAALHHFGDAVDRNHFLAQAVTAV